MTKDNLLKTIRELSIYVAALFIAIMLTKTFFTFFPPAYEFIASKFVKEAKPYFERFEEGHNTEYYKKLSEEMQGIIETSAAFKELNQNVALLRVSKMNTEVGDIQKKLDNVSAQLHSLQQIISPKNIDDILTVAKMKEEILARNKFQESVENKLIHYDSRITKVNDKFDMIQLSIWGTLISVIVGLFGVTVFLSKKLSFFMGMFLDNKDKTDTIKPASEK